MSDKYTDNDKTTAPRPLPRRNRKPYEEYTPADVSARLNEARKDLTDPKSPLAKLLSDPDDLEQHLQKVERLLVSSIERSFIKVGKKFNRKRFVERVSALQSKSRPPVASVPAPVEQEVIPEKKERPVTAASKPAPAPVKTSKPEEVEKVVVVDKKGDLSGVKVGDLVSPQKAADEEEPDDTKSRGLLRRAGRDMFSTAFPTLSKLTKKRKGGEEESTKEKLSRLGKDVFKTTFPTLNRVIEYVESEKKQKSTEGVRETTRSRRALDKTESMNSSLQLFTTEQRKSVDLLEELLEVVKGLRTGQQGGGRLGRFGRIIGAAGQALGAAGSAIRAAPMLAGAAAVGAAGLGAYALSRASNRTEEATERTEAAREGETEDQVYERLIQGYPDSWRDDVNVQNDVRTEARLLIQQRDRQQTREPPAATPALSQRPDPLTAEQRRGFQERQAALRQTDEELQRFRQQHGAPSTRESRDGFSTEEFYEDPELQRQFNEIRQRRSTATRDTQRSLGSAEFSLLGPSRFRDQGITGRDDGRMLSLDQQARAIDLLKTRYGYSEEELQRFGGGPGRDNFIQVGNRRYSPQVIGLFRQMVERDLEQEMPAAIRQQIPEGATPIRSNGQVVGYMPAGGGPTVTFTDADRQVLEGARTQVMGSTTPPSPPSNNNADLVTRTSATGTLKDRGVAAKYSKSPVTPTNVSGMDSVLKAKTGTFKGDEVKFVAKPPSQTIKPGVSTPPSAPSVATPVPAPVVSGGGGGASSEGSGSQQLTTEQEGAADTGSLTFASGVDPRIKKDIAQKVQQIESAFGKKLTITSGFRDPHRNAAAGGARNSAHTRANAVDIRFQGNEEETNKLIEAASAAGIGGIGVYRPGWVHLDVESKRVWGPDFSARTVPEWAKDTLQAHMTGQIQKSPAGEAAAAEPVAASPASPSMAEAPSSGGGGEGGGQIESSGSTAAAAPAPEPTGNEMGAAVSGASQENAMAERTPVAPTVTAVQSESQAQPTPGAAVPDSSMKSVNDPGSVEPDDAAERYAKLFNMAA